MIDWPALQLVYKSWVGLPTASSHLRDSMTIISMQSLLVYSLIAATAVSSFQITPRTSDRPTRLYSDTRGKNGKTKFGQRTDAEVSRFLTDFRTADGNVVDPYRMLQVSRSATRIEIKQSYRRLSRKLHPDMVAQSEILPGRW